MTDAVHYNPDPHAHPGLHVIAVFEAAKGLLALFAASGLELLGPKPLLRWLQELATRFQLDPHDGGAGAALDVVSGIVRDCREGRLVRVRQRPARRLFL